MKRSVSRDAIIQMPIHALKHSMKTRDLALEEVYDAYQDHIARCNPVINAYTQTSSQEMSPDVHEGPLSGIPVAIKDIFDVLGYETTAGSSFFSKNAKTGCLCSISVEAARVRGIGKNKYPRICHGRNND